MPDQLRFGLNPPDGVHTAWGARWIIDAHGSVDEVWDRTDAIGPPGRRHQLLDYLNSRVARAPAETACRLLAHGELSWSDDATVTLYDDQTVTIVANPLRSFGYLYVGAWFKADQPPPAPEPT